MERALLIYTVLLVFLLNLFSVVYLLSLTNPIHVTAQASGATAQICINAPPSIIVPCNATMIQGEPFTCQLNYSDVNVGQNWTFSASWPGVSIFSVPSNGSLSFTPDNDDVGNHSVTFFVNDSASCDNGVDNETFNFSVVDVNDAPVLLENLPDISFTVNTTTLAYFLSDYYYDPDGDVLSYTATIPGSPFTLTLIGSGVQVTANSCDGEEEFEATVQFTATDTSNASTDSNLVTITVNCPDDDDEDDDDQGEGSGSGGGSGGGGGGGACLSEWECLDWMGCLPTGFEWKQCYDLNGCENPKFLKRECTYAGENPECQENWLCNDWGACHVNKTQYRSCTDLNACGTAFYEPYEEQRCIYLPTCSDGIKNGDETAVDCGGSCAACSVIETPSFITPEKFNLWLLIAILLALLFVGGVFRIYREEVVRGLSWLLLYLSRKHEKEVLLSREERTLLFERIVTAEKAAMVDGDPAVRYGKITVLAREFLQTLAHLPEEFTREELAQALSARGVSVPLQQLLLSFFDKIYAVEEQPLSFDLAFFFSLSEELRLFVCVVSEYSVQDIERSLVTFETTEDLSFLEELFIHLVRAYRALQFEQYVFAKKEYEHILRVYENLPAEDQSAVYGEAAHVFSLLRYAVEHAKLEN